MAQSECLTYFIIPCLRFLPRTKIVLCMYYVYCIVFITWSSYCLTISCFRGLVSCVPVSAACARWPGGGPRTLETRGWQWNKKWFNTSAIRTPHRRSRAGSVYANTNCIGFAWHSARTLQSRISVLSRRRICFLFAFESLFHITHCI